MNDVTDKKPIIEALNAVMRGMDPDRSATRYDATVDDPILERLWSQTDFPIGSSMPLGGIDGRHEHVHAMLRRLDAARTASIEAREAGRPDPVTLSLSGIDWGWIKHLEGSDHALRIGMPTVIGGTWIGDDVPRMLDVAGAALLDTMVPSIRSHSIERVWHAYSDAATLAAALYAIDGEAGWHVTLPSPFGPGEVRRHDVTGSPYAAYGMPDVGRTAVMPEAYEIDANCSSSEPFSVSMDITRSRAFNGDRNRFERGPDAVDAASCAVVAKTFIGDLRPKPSPDPDIAEKTALREARQAEIRNALTPEENALADLHQELTNALREEKLLESNVARLAEQAAANVVHGWKDRTEDAATRVSEARMRLETMRIEQARANPLIGRTVTVPAVEAKRFSRGKPARRGVVEVYTRNHPYSGRRPPEVGQIVVRLLRKDGTRGEGVIELTGDRLPEDWIAE
jgi:hypothetical protein